MLVHVLLHVSSAYNHQYNVHRLRQPIDWCSLNCFHASIHEHTHHHHHIIVHSNVFILWQACSIHVHILSPWLACIHCMHINVFTACFQCMQVPTSVSSTTTDDRCSMNCFHTSIHAHTHQCAQNSILSTVDRASAFWHSIAAYASLMHNGILWRITLEHCILHLWTLIVW